MGNTPSLYADSFPPGFRFGTSGSAYQYEGAAYTGGKGPSIWDEFTSKVPAPDLWTDAFGFNLPKFGTYPEHWGPILLHELFGKIADASTGTVANDSYHRYKEDVAIMKRMGLNAYKFSISWPRILPSGKLRDGVNKEGVNYYSSLIDELLANDIEPWVALFHWDLPQALEREYGGFLNRQIIDDFCDYAEVCFWEFGDRVKHWITLNEPWSFTTYGYVMGEHAPGHGIHATPLSPAAQIKTRTLASNVGLSSTITALHRMAALDRYNYSRREELHPRPLVRTNLATGYTVKGDPETEPYQVAHHLLLAHARAVGLYKKNFKKIQKGIIGITLNTTWYEPLREGNKEDLVAAQRALDFKFGWFMDPLTRGTYPSNVKTFVEPGLLPTFSDQEAKNLKGSFDFIGLNYYTSNYATIPDPSDQKALGPFHTQGDRDGVPIGPKGSSFWIYSYPEGLRKMLSYMKKNYGDPVIYITENGVDEMRDNKLTISETRDDEIRQDYLEQHLSSLRDAIYEDKVNVKGYFVWSLLDNFEWSGGYTPCYGMNYVDYNNGLARYPRKSAIWYTNFIKGGDECCAEKYGDGDWEKRGDRDDARAIKKRKS